MRKIYIILAIAVVSAFLIECESPTDTTAFKTREAKFEEINQIPGFTWFSPRFNIYTPDSSIIEAVKPLMSQNINFYFFSMPACTCEHTQDMFPNAYKVLKNAGIDSLRYKFILMKDTLSENPYSNIVKIKTLPEIYLIKNNNAVYSIGDTLRKRSADSLIVKSGKAKVEQIILEALQQNQ